MLKFNKGDIHIHNHDTYYVIPEHMVASTSKKKDYNVGMFLVDAGLTLLTSGIWLFWVFIREMRK